MITINFCNTTYLTDTMHSSAMALLPDFMQKQASAYVKEEDRKRCVLGKLLLLKGLMDLGYGRHVLSGVRPGNHQRPYLNSQVDFNISHAGNYVACALSTETRLGIDLEQVQPLNLDSMKELVLNENECKRLAEAQRPLDYFYDIWTLKEAALKAGGTGLMSPISEVEISRDQVLFCGESWNYQYLAIHPDYKCHIVYKGNASLRLRELKAAELLPAALF